MARADTKTWLPLDTWAEIMGVNPLHFNGLISDTLFPGTVCGQPWQSFAWQSSDKIGREDLAFAIRKAELQIAGEVGYNLMPDWKTQERLSTTRPANPLLYNATGLNIRGQRQSIDANQAYIISGGIKTKTLIEAGVAVVRSDSNGDTYDDLVTISVATTVTEEGEVRIYFPGEAGADIWEIRPTTVSISGGVATITCKSWQIVDPDEQNQVSRLGDNQGVDALDDTKYIGTVDVYRLFNDPQQQAQLLTEPWGNANTLSGCLCGLTSCPSCSFSAQFACLMVRDERLGIFSYAPATWDADTETFTIQQHADCRNADQIRLWYYSGWRDTSLDRPNFVMDRYWQLAVAYYAASLLDRATCGCSNVSEQIEHWRRDKSRSGGDLSFAISPHQLDNPFGTTEGAFFALRSVDEPGRKVGR